MTSAVLEAGGPLVESVSAEMPAKVFQCDHCGKLCSGEPSGSGLFVWTRGEDVRFEEPPLCGRCANKLSLSAHVKWAAEDDVEG